MPSDAEQSLDTEHGGQWTRLAQRAAARVAFLVGLVMGI